MNLLLKNSSPDAEPQGAACSTRYSSTKLQAHHLEGAALVYVRQSTAQQVLDHRESTARQYALVDLAVELGWSADCIEIIDEDQGHCSSTAEDRSGFHRLLAEVGLDHVGIILGLELCRLARSNKDWHQMIELCANFRTLLADQDGLYDPTDYNDRLLLGLRGIMNEAELHIWQGIMHQALLNKVKRGDLYIRACTRVVVSSPMRSNCVTVGPVECQFEPSFNRRRKSGFRSRTTPLFTCTELSASQISCSRISGSHPNGLFFRDARVRSRGNWWSNSYRYDRLWLGDDAGCIEWHGGGIVVVGVVWAAQRRGQFYAADDHDRADGLQRSNCQAWPNQ